MEGCVVGCVEKKCPLVWCWPVSFYVWEVCQEICRTFFTEGWRTTYKAQTWTTACTQWFWTDFGNSVNNRQAQHLSEWSTSQTLWCHWHHCTWIYYSQNNSPSRKKIEHIAYQRSDDLRAQLMSAISIYDPNTFICRWIWISATELNSKLWV